MIFPQLVANGEDAIDVRPNPSVELGCVPVAGVLIALTHRVQAENVKLQTRDGVELSASYYPSRNAKDPTLGKQVTPVVLLHDEKDTQGMFSSLVGQTASDADEAGTSPPLP